MSKKLREIVESKKEDIKKTPEEHEIHGLGDLFGPPQKGDPKFLPQFKNKPGTKGHFDELLAHHEYHSEKWAEEAERRSKQLKVILPNVNYDTPAMKHHSKAIIALEDHAEKHYMKHWNKIHKDEDYESNNPWHFRNMLDNISNSREGSEYKEEAERQVAQVRKRLPD